MHRTIKKVTEDIDQQKYNTAIAAMMQCVNDMYHVKQSAGFADASSWRFTLESLAMLLAPFAPHIAEELWHDLGHTDSIHVDHWPKWDAAWLTSGTVSIAVQVNGKLRGQIEVDADASEAEVTAAARADEKVAGHLQGTEPKKTIVVPGKLVNFVI